MDVLIGIFVIGVYVVVVKCGVEEIIGVLEVGVFVGCLEKVFVVCWVGNIEYRCLVDW